MWPWSATALKEQLDRIERNQLRIAAALSIRDLELAPLGVPEKIAPRAPRRKLTEADVHFSGRPTVYQAAMASQAAASAAAAPQPPLAAPSAPAPTTVDLEGAEPVINLLSNLPLASQAPQRPSAPPAAQAMHWRDSGSLNNQLP